MAGNNGKGEELLAYPLEIAPGWQIREEELAL